VSWKVTVRHGSEVQRSHFETLEAALDSARGEVASVLTEGRLGTVRMLREFTPDLRVHARVEISGPGLLWGPEGGLDVMGDGAVVAYTGAIRKRQVGADTLDEAFERLRERLGG
jgi:hypothetical protein